MKKTVVIDCFPESAERYRLTHSIVVIDVIRATTTAVTALSQGRRVFPVQTTDEAFVLAPTLDDPLMVGELGGNMPYGFDLTNSPALLAARTGDTRPIVLVSSSGTQLLLNSLGAKAVYVCSLRNLTATASVLAGFHDRIALLGAGSRGQFRWEDQIGCAWLGQKLLESGYAAEDEQTADRIERWRGASTEVIRKGHSAEYLRRSGQEIDLEFILSRVDDLSVVACMKDRELVALPAEQIDALGSHRAAG